MNQIVTPAEFPFVWFRKIKFLPRPVGNHAGHYKMAYKNIVTAFDIECSTIETAKGPQAFMYVWQWQFGTEYTVIGRTWDELKSFIKKLTKGMFKEQGIWVAVHNLSYEFQFLRGVFHFGEEDVFCMKSRKILSARLPHIEFHCSYIHSNMSLKAYLKKMGVEHQKKSGADFNYGKIRYPWTPLTNEELEYAVNDVLGLVEALQVHMKAENDTLYTFPQTSTGYVRRRAKKAMREMPHKWLKDQLPDYEVYKLLREAFRGGNTHANRWAAGKVLHNVKSADRSSSYPDVMVNREFPISQFVRDPDESFEHLTKLCFVNHRAGLFRLRIWNIRLRDKYCPIPYLSKDKCRNIRNGDDWPNVYDNGRILSAGYIETTMTDIDLKIVLSQYDFDAIEAFDVYTARYGRLPDPLVKLICQLYHDKTSLKGVEGQEIYYALSKEMINAVYGMTCQDPVKDRIEYVEDSEEVYVERGEAPEQLLENYQNKAFLTYAWGVWTTAHARAALQEGIDLAGEGCVYVDTDSVKYIGDVDWSEFNARCIADSTKNGACAEDKSGSMHYMGVFEQEQDYYEFATLGAKKYAYRYEPRGKMHATIAGVSKHDVLNDAGEVVRAGGGTELDRHGGFSAFLTEGFVFHDAGGTELIYNDDLCEDVIEVDGHALPITTNVVIRDSTYTLGITAEYRELLFNISEEDTCIFDNIEV